MTAALLTLAVLGLVFLVAGVAVVYWPAGLALLGLAFLGVALTTAWARGVS